jgi:hypothetical protein
MADAKPAAPTEDIRKKCAGTGVTLRRKRRYYRNGKYFLNKNAYKMFVEKENEKKAAEAPAAS